VSLSYVWSMRLGELGRFEIRIVWKSLGLFGLSLMRLGNKHRRLRNVSYLTNSCSPDEGLVFLPN
jgi:hypothetical protein